MKLRIITSLAAMAATAVPLLAQEVTPVWYEHINGLFNVAAGDKLPTLVKTPEGGDEQNNGSSTLDCYAQFLRYDDDHYLLGIRENGINENDPNLTQEQKDLAAAYPDRSIVWLDAKTGKPQGIAFKCAIRPVENAAGGANNTPDFFWKWGIDEGAYGQKVIFTTYRYKVLRWAPSGTVADANFPKGRPTWSETPTEAWVEPVPGEPNPTIIPGERGTEPGVSGGGSSGSWRLKAFRVSGAGATTKLWAGGATWRHSMHEQEFVTDDEGQTFRPIARLNDRGDGGGSKGFFSLGGQPSSIRTDVGDPTRPNMEWTIQGHYPGTGWPARPNRYTKNPDPFVYDKDGNQVDNVRSNRFDATWGGPNDAWRSVENQAIGRLPAFAWESAGTRDVCGPEHAVDGVSVYDGNWSLTTDTRDGLDYIVSYSMPSWDNQFGPIKKPAWIGVHTLDGKIAPGKSSQRLDFVESDEHYAGNGPERGSDWVYDGNVEVYPDPTSPPGVQRSLVLWVCSASGFGVATVENKAVAGNITDAQDLTVDENHAVVLAGKFVGVGSPVFFQWQKDDGTGNFVDVKDGWGNLARFGQLGTAVTLSFSSPKVADSGKYRFWVGNSINKFTSGVVNLTVKPDTTAPGVVSAGSTDGSAVDIAFDEALDQASAETLSNYTLSGGASAGSATLRNGKTVRLAGVSGLPASFTVTVKNVADISGNAIAAAGKTVSGIVQGWISTDVNVNANYPGSDFSVDGNTVEVEAGGNDIWGTGDSFHFVYKEVSGNFDVRVQIAAHAPGGNRNGIMARTDLDPSAAHVFQGWNSGAGYISSARASAGAGAGWNNNGRNNWIPTPCDSEKFTANPPKVWLRMSRSGSTFTTYRSVDGKNWILDGTGDFDLPDGLLLGLASNAGGNGYTRTTYANYGEAPSLSLAGNKLTWKGQGVLQTATSILGPWTDAADQTNGQTVTPGTASGSVFYSLRNP